MFLNSRKCKLGNVVDVAVASGNFKTLLKIISELEVPTLRSMTLVDVLKMQRQVTIFAPSDEAFAKLPKGTIESWTKEQKLKIVFRHIIPEKTLCDYTEFSGVGYETFGNETIDIVIPRKEGVRNVQIHYQGNIINVVTPDIIASNGCIMGIDKVILPLIQT